MYFSSKVFISWFLELPYGLLSIDYLFTIMLINTAYRVGTLYRVLLAKYEFILKY